MWSRLLLYAAALAIGMLPAACSSPLHNGADVEIRVVNSSPFAFDSVRVLFPADEVRYGALAPGAPSSYRRVAEAYSYAFIEVWSNGQRYVLQPIDFVGESLLPPGRYTYRLGLGGNPRQLSLTFLDS